VKSHTTTLSSRIALDAFENWGLMLPRIKTEPTFLIVIVIVILDILRRKNVSHPKLQCSDTVQPVDTSFTRVIGQHCHWIYHCKSLSRCVVSWLCKLWYYCEQIKPRRIVSLRVIKSIDIHGSVILPKKLRPFLPFVFFAF
jgi:hypothetical protein